MDKRRLHTDHVTGYDVNTIISLCKQTLKRWFNGLFCVYPERLIVFDKIGQHCPLVANLSHNLKNLQYSVCLESLIVFLHIYLPLPHALQGDLHSSFQTNASRHSPAAETAHELLLQREESRTPPYLNESSAGWRWPWPAAGPTPIADTPPQRWPSGGNCGRRCSTQSGRSPPPRCALWPRGWSPCTCGPSLPGS